VVKLHKTIRLGDVADLKFVCPEPLPNSEPILIGIASALILQNPILVAVFLVA
jgi:hypothetical protein